MILDVNKPLLLVTVFVLKPTDKKGTEASTPMRMVSKILANTGNPKNVFKFMPYFMSSDAPIIVTAAEIIAIFQLFSILFMNASGISIILNHNVPYSLCSSKPFSTAF
jgi:hypothetical protein